MGVSVAILCVVHSNSVAGEMFKVPITSLIRTGMRKREEIENEVSLDWQTFKGGSLNNQNLMLEILLDIRDLLQASSQIK